MKIIKRLLSLSTAMVLSLSSLLVFAPAITHAVAKTCTWTGGGSDAKFSTAANWSGCASAAPLAGDTLAFPALGTKQAPVNDTILAYAAVNFTGASGTCSAAPFDWYDITGTQPLTTSIIDNTMTGSCPSVLLDLSITAPSNIIISGSASVFVGSTDTASVFDIGSNTLSVSNTSSVTIYDKLSGSGAINSSSSLTFDANSSGYSGTITQNSSNLTFLNYAGSSLGTGSAVINDTADLAVYVCDGGTFSNNLTFNGASSFTTGDFPQAKLTVSDLTCPRPTGGGAGGGGGCSGTCPSYDEVYAGGSAPTTGSVTLSGAIAQGADTTVVSFAKTATITGAITGGKAISLTAGGGGTFVINSSSNGSTTPNGTYNPPPIRKTLSDSLPTHTVDVNGNYELTIDGARGATTIETGAVLKGTGTVGALTIMTGGKVAPGHSPGCLSSGNLVLNGILDEEIGGTVACTGYDQLKVTGTVDVTSGTLNVSLYNGFKPVLGQKYTIIDNDGTADAVTGTFTGLAEGATVTSGKYSFKISYKGGDGNDVVLSVIGTPDTGFELISSHPLATFLTMTLLAAGIALAGRRYHKLLNR